MSPRIMLLLAACLLALSTPAQAQGEEEIETQRCIATRQIKSPVVIDDQNILFFMRQDKVYRNRLPETCKGLLRYKTFSYQQIAGRICESDLIHLYRTTDPTVLRRCKIGIFEEIDSQDIPALVASLHRPPAAEDLPSAEVEDVSKQPETEDPPGDQAGDSP